MHTKPIRKITNHGREIVTGGFASKKNKAIVRWESQLERDFLYHLEFDDTVQSYRSQSLKLSYHYDGKMRHHYPDIEVTRADHRIDYYEVKPFEKTDNDEFQSKYKAITTRLEQLGHRYWIVTEEYIRVEPILSNLKILYRYIDVDIALQVEKTILDFVEDNMYLYELNHLIVNTGFNLSECYALMARGKIKFDLESPINLDMKISKVG